MMLQVKDVLHTLNVFHLNLSWQQRKKKVFSLD